MKTKHASNLPKPLTRVESLPSLPAAAVEVLRLSEDENAGVAEYARAVARDPALAAKLLKLANSSLFSTGREVTTLDTATSLLGLRAVRLMALGFSLVGALPRDGGAPSFDHDLFWRRSLLAATAGRDLAISCDVSLADEAFLCGLLAHLGQLVMAHAIPATYEPLLARLGRWPSPRDEREALGFDHHAVAAVLLSSWGLPEAVRLPVVHASDPEGLPEQAPEHVRTLTGLIGAALSAVQLVCDPGKGEALGVLHAQGQRFALSTERVDMLLLGLEQHALEAMALLDLETSTTGEGAYELLLRARQQLSEAAIGTAAELRRGQRRTRQLEQEVRALTEQLSRDSLTGLASRAHFEEALRRHVQARTGRDVVGAVGVLLVDVDHFKGVNDSHGHAAGDEVLGAIGRALASTSRDTDLPARLGGDEFAVLVPSTTPDHLRAFGERLRRFVAEIEIALPGKTLTVTASLGGACLARAAGPDDGKRLLDEADQRLYRAKSRGRNRVEVTSEILGAEDEVGDA